MTDPLFPFEADVDPDAERAARGPVDRRDLLVTLLIAAAGALITGAAGAVAVLELEIYPDALAAVVSGLGPFAAWIAGAVLAFTRLARRRRRAWLPMLIAVGAGVLLAVIGVLLWLPAAELL